MESRGPEDYKTVKTSQAYFFGGFISFFEDFSQTYASSCLRLTDHECVLTIRGGAIQDVKTDVAYPQSIKSYLTGIRPQFRLLEKNYS